MTSPAHAQILISVVSGLGQLVSHRTGSDIKRDQMRQELALAELRASTLAHVVDAVISRRISVVQDGFRQVMQEFAAQAQHYMAQQARFADAELETSDPLRRIELRKRINDIDTELRQLRVDVRLLYTRMTEVLVLIGSSSFPLEDGTARPVMLTSSAG